MSQLAGRCLACCVRMFEHRRSFSFTTFGPDCNPGPLTTGSFREFFIPPHKKTNKPKSENVFREKLVLYCSAFSQGHSAVDATTNPEFIRQSNAIAGIFFFLFCWCERTELLADARDKVLKLCYTQRTLYVYAPVHLRLILYPLTLWDREALCLGGNMAPATQLTRPHKHAIAAGQQESGGGQEMARTPSWRSHPVLG